MNSYTKTTNKLLIPKPNWSGRYGNNITQLMNMLCVAHKNNNSVFVPNNKPYGLKKQIVKFNNNMVSFFIENIEEEIVNFNTKYIINPYFMGHSKEFRKNYGRDYKYNIKDCLIETLKLKNDISNDLFDSTEDNDLYIHIRSGDVHRNLSGNTIVYAQPPISFYDKIIKDNSFRKVYILSDDSKNFLIEKLISIYGKDYCTTIEEPNPIKAFDMLRNCKHIATSTSSFCTMAIFLTPNHIKKNVYTYNYLTNIYHHWFLCDIFDEYNIYNNQINNIKFNIYNINNFTPMNNCNIHQNLYTDFENKLWWKNGNDDFKFNWKFNDEIKQLLLDHSISNITKEV